ncbi:MAG: helix-turn-helix domain-containing protein, partial [Thauera sp.]
APVVTQAEGLARGRGRRPKDIDDAAIRAALERFDGNLSAAARYLGVARNTLYRRMGCDF